MTLAPPHTLGFAFIGKGPINCENKLIEDKGFNKNDQPCGPWHSGINFQTHFRQPLSNSAKSHSVLTEWAEFPASLTSIFGARWNSTDASPSTGLLSFRTHTDYYQQRRLPRTVQANTLY